MMFAGDTALIEATFTLTAWMDGLAKDGSDWGVVHGDFELDNLAWADDRPTAYDFDEAAVSWFAANIAYALRDLADQTGHVPDEHLGQFDAFIAGYRGVRPLDEQDLSRLPLFAGLHASASMVRIARARGGAGKDEPGWLAELRGKLTERVCACRQLVVNTAAQAG
jgi:Ser/Thr protein kinase RdoA (MazF antagonist)